MSLYDSEGVEAYVVLNSGHDVQKRLADVNGIYLTLSGAFFDGGDFKTPPYTAATQPALRLARLNVQGFAGYDGRVEKLYMADVVSEIDITTRTHLAAIALAEMALGHFRDARKDQRAGFAESSNLAIPLKLEWLKGGANPQYLIDLYSQCSREIEQIMWDDRGRRTDPISHALGAVSRLAYYCLLLDAKGTLSHVVRDLTNIVSVEYDVRMLSGGLRGGGWSEIESSTAGLAWDVEGTLKRILLTDVVE